MKWTLLLLAILLPLVASAQEDEHQPPGQVRLPLEVYNQLVEQSRTPRTTPRPAPVSFALGSATVHVRVASLEPRASAEVRVALPIEVLENEWVLVPVLPPGTAVARATVSGSPVQLVSTPDGLAYGTNVKGTYSMELAYSVDAASTGKGYVLAVPAPGASSIELTAVLPGAGLDVSVIPSAGQRTSVSGSQTSVQASVPATRGIQIAWRVPSEKGPVISRASYRGTMEGGSILWRAELRVELFAQESATVALLPTAVTLTSLTVDGKESPILVEGGRFATLMHGQGAHTVVASFQTPVVSENGPPRTELLVPQVPVSRIVLALPGRKDVTASPAASVATELKGGATEATIHVPLTQKVALSWSEAVPEMARRELRANASIYHVARAEEGVLTMRAHVAFEVQHGATNRIGLALPVGVEVNQITSETGAVADWRVEARGNARVLRVFLDRELTKELVLVVDYDRSLEGSDAGVLPLLEALGVGRQRGMVALVPTRDRALNPTEEGGATRVGENQLPSFVRAAIDRTIAHTFKYTDQPPSIAVVAAVPERAAGRFDATVDTLVSLGDVTVLSSASIEIHVKSGGLDRLDLVLPEGANLLNLVAPSLRVHRVTDGVVEVELTQEMEGDFRVEVETEHLLGENETEVEAPTLRVRGADVESGRIAVEASSTVEVAPLATEELTPLDVRELPRQLVLRTSHPILHAFRYVRAEPAPRLALGVTRHEMAAVQEAVIDRAEHRTLFTREGLAVTTTKLLVRNTRRQFLRVQLPPDSEMWSVFVAGKAEKPAVDGAEEERAFLIKIVSSTKGFPVEIVYATRVASLGGLGSVRAKLARPDLLVTASRFDLFVPEGLDYGRPETNMQVVLSAASISREELAREMAADRAAAAVPDPFRIHVPADGVHYAFEMLYANHGDVEPFVTIAYASGRGIALGQVLSLAGAFLLFVVVRLRLTKDERFSKPLQGAVALLGALLVAIPVGVYGVSALPALVFVGVLALVSSRSELRRVLEGLRRSRTAPQNG